MTIDDSGGFVTGICDRSRIRMFYGLPIGRLPIVRRLSRRDPVATEGQKERTLTDWPGGGLARVGSI